MCMYFLGHVTKYALFLTERRAMFETLTILFHLERSQRFDLLYLLCTIDLSCFSCFFILLVCLCIWNKEIDGF